MQLKLSVLLLSFYCLHTIQIFGQQLQRDIIIEDSTYNNNTPTSKQKLFQQGVWELGIHGGNVMVAGDIKPLPNVGGSISLRKAINKVFSLRAAYFGAFTQGEPTAARRLNEGQVNFKTWIHALGLDVVASLNPPLAETRNRKVNIYALAGLDLVAAKAFYQKNNGSQLGNKYETFYGLPRAGVNRNTLNGTITTFGGTEVRGRKTFTLLGGASFGAGFSVKLNNRFSVGAEQRFTFTKYDYLDAFKGGISNDVITYTSAHINIAIGRSSNKEQPLWWSYPGNIAVKNVTNNPPAVPVVPTVKDSDDDGVIDELDKDPSTPAHVIVDIDGVPLDTDKDGVPDYRDRELLTAARCFPVDAEGKGKCFQPPAKPKTVTRPDTIAAKKVNCSGTISTVKYPAGTFLLSQTAKVALESVAQKIKKSNCNILVLGHGDPNKKEQQLSWVRVNGVIRYLVEKKGISANRFIFSYGEEGLSTNVNLSFTTETKPNSVPYPY